MAAPKMAVDMRVGDRCPRCEIFKPVREFFKNPGTHTGHTTYCRPCEKEVRSDPRYRSVAAARNVLIYRTRKLSGVCTSCGSERLIGWQLCEKHHYVAIARDRMGIPTVAAGERLRIKLIEQDYKCPYTGTQLIPGKNMELDHILPVSRFPDLRADFDNVEWILADVNHAKSSQTKDEFLALCRSVVRRSDGVS